MIDLRVCESDDDLEVWLAVRRAVLPRDRTVSLDELKRTIKPGALHLLADLDGELAGSGLVNRSDTGGAHIAPRVLPDKRGRGLGAALLERLAAHAVERGFAHANSHVSGGDERSIAFARRFGFGEARREVQQVLTSMVSPPSRAKSQDSTLSRSKPARSCCGPRGRSRSRVRGRARRWARHCEAAASPRR